MKTIILNGSPKGNTENSGSYFLAKAFVSRMKVPSEIHAVAKENRRELLELIRQAANIIIITPNYIHSVPSGMLELLQALPKAQEKQSIGLIIQAGYPEAAESEIMCRFFHRLATRLGYDELGMVVKGECAGLAIMPEKFGKLKEQFAKFGELYEQTGRFDERRIKDFAKPATLSKAQMWLLNAMNPIGNSFGWHKIMKENNAFANRSDMPYLD